MTGDGDRSPRLEAYLHLVATRLAWFDGPGDGLVVATSQVRIAEIQAVTAARYESRGLPGAWAEVGIRYQDPYVMLLIDAVTFPDGGVGVHHRVMRITGDNSGVAVLPLIDGQIILIRHFRHPLRRWTWEMPRGAIEAGATAEETVRAELNEEIEAQIVGMSHLGQMYGATGFMGLAVQLYVATLASFGRPAVGEGIAEVRLVTVDEFQAMVLSSEVVDSFTLGAFLHARLKDLI